MIGILNSFGSTFPFWIFLDDEVDNFKLQINYWICCKDVTTGSMADPAVICKALWSLGQTSKSRREKLELKLGGITQNCWIMSYRIGLHQKLAHSEKSVSSLPGTVSKGHSSDKDGFCPWIRSKGILPKERLLSTDNNLCFYSQPNINMGQRKEGSPKAYKETGD